MRLAKTRDISAVRDKKGPIESLTLIANSAFSVANFRGPLVRALVACGVRVYALAPDFDERTRGATIEIGAEPVRISLQRTGMHPLQDIADFFRLAVTLRRLRPDATLAYFIKPVIYGSLAAWVARIPRRFALVAGLGYAFAPGELKLSLRRRLLLLFSSGLYFLAFSVCTRVFFFNDDDIDYFVRRRLIRQEKAKRLQATGVDLSHFAPAPPVKSPLTFLLVARLLKEKGIREYVDAARVIKAQHPDVRFLLVGGFDPNPGGLSPPEVRAWVDEGVIEWPGHVDDVRPWIAQSSVYVLPSYREGVPRSTQEAMAMGRPVITTDSPGCRDTVQDGVNGFLVPIRDATALAEAMRNFIERPDLIDTMGAQSRLIAEARFDVRVINARLLGELGVMVAEKP